MTPRAFDWAGVVDYARRYPVEPPRTQYELPGVTVETHQDVPVAVVPLWHAVVTTLATALGVPFLMGVGEGISRARYYPDFRRIRVKLLADPKTLVSEAGAPGLDRTAKHGPDRGVQPPGLRRAEAPGQAGRVDAAVVQDLAGVDVADAGHDRLVESPSTPPASSLPSSASSVCHI